MDQLTILFILNLQLKTQEKVVGPCKRNPANYLANAAL
jgi:hypothetical protein